MDTQTPFRQALDHRRQPAAEVGAEYHQTGEGATTHPKSLLTQTSLPTVIRSSRTTEGGKFVKPTPSLHWSMPYQATSTKIHPPNPHSYHTTKCWKRSTYTEGGTKRTLLELAYPLQSRVGRLSMKKTRTTMRHKLTGKLEQKNEPATQTKKTCTRRSEKSILTSSLGSDWTRYRRGPSTLHYARPKSSSVNPGVRRQLWTVFHRATDAIERSIVGQSSTDTHCPVHHCIVL